MTDNGAYFDAREFESPGDRDLLNCEPGGFGISLIKERASRLFYTRISDLNHLVIVCERSRNRGAIKRAAGIRHS